MKTPRSLLRFRHYSFLFGTKGVVLFVREMCGDRRVVRVTPRVRRYHVHHHPFLIRLGTTDVEVAWTVLWRGDYDIVPLFSAGAIVDAGAYVGFSSIFFARKFPHARILALEPEPDNFALMRMNVAPDRNIQPIKAALWTRPIRMALQDRGIGEWGYTLVANTHVSNRLGGSCLGEVQCLDMAELCERFRMTQIDILKLDIEGAEREVLSDCDSWIDRVRVIVAELHDRFVPGCTEAWEHATRGFRWRSRSPRGLVMAVRE